MRRKGWEIKKSKTSRRKGKEVEKKFKDKSLKMCLDKRSQVRHLILTICKVTKVKKTHDAFDRLKYHMHQFMVVFPQYGLDILECYEKDASGGIRSEYGIPTMLYQYKSFLP